MVTFHGGGGDGNLYCIAACANRLGVLGNIMVTCACCFACFQTALVCHSGMIRYPVICLRMICLIVRASMEWCMEDLRTVFVWSSLSFCIQVMVCTGTIIILCNVLVQAFVE